MFAGFFVYIWFTNGLRMPILKFKKGRGPKQPPKGIKESVEEIYEKVKSRFSRSNDNVVFETTTQHLNEDDIIKELDKLSYDPIELSYKLLKFGKVLTGIPLYEYQEEFAFRIFYAVVSFENETLTGLWSRQAGKSETVAFVICTLIVIMPTLSKVYKEFEQYKRGFRIGLYAPQQLQVDTTYDRTIERLGSENAQMVMSDPDFDITLNKGKKISLTNGSHVTGQVASKSSKIESKTWDLVIIEETQDMDDFVMQKSIEPMLTATAGNLVKVGTTGTQKNSFYEDIQHNRKRSIKIKDERLRYHFEYDYKKVIEYKRKQYLVDGNRFHMNYEKDVMKKREKWGGEDSDAFKLGFALVWAMETGMFMTDADFDRITDKRLGRAEYIQEDWYICAGLDIAKDSDSTVLTIGRSYYNDDGLTEPPIKQIFCWIELHKESYELQHQILLQALIDWNVQVLYGDYTGVGRPVLDRLMASCGDHVTIVPYTFTTPSKSEMYFALSADIVAGRLRVPANRVVRKEAEYCNFETQMKGLRKSYNGGYMVCNHGTGIGDHDDYPDSCALFVMAANHEIPQDVEVSQTNPFYNNNRGLIPSHRNCHW